MVNSCSLGNTSIFYADNDARLLPLVSLWPALGRGSFSRGNSQREAVLEKSHNPAVAYRLGLYAAPLRPKLLGLGLFLRSPGGGLPQLGGAAAFLILGDGGWMAYQIVNRRAC